VTRVSRAHTIWLDTAVAGTRFLAPLVSPAPGEQPPGTGLVLAFRGATGFSPDALDAPFDADRIDAYGEISAGTVLFLDGDSTWSASPSSVDAARYVQARVTFVNHVPSGASPALSSLALAFEHD
jgi:hypothetical protein